VSFILFGGRGQNRTADTRIFNFKNHHLYIVLGPPSLVKTRQSVTKLSRYKYLFMSLFRTKVAIKK